MLPVLAPPLKGKVPDGAKEALTVAPALDSLPAGSTDGPGAQEEPLLAKLGTQGKGEQHPACWHGPGCRHLLAPSLPGHGEGGGLDKVGGGPGCREPATRGPSGLIQAGAGLSLEGDPALLGDNLTASHHHPPSCWVLGLHDPCSLPPLTSPQTSLRHTPMAASVNKSSRRLCNMGANTATV